MKVSQFIYTSYKNSPNGGYAVYSQSSDISPEDSKVIFLMMQYPAVPMLSDMRRALNDMTWNPIEISKIEGVCPRSFGYFRLPSGKYCMAEAGYIGPEFKGFTPSGRTGNYLIHAFVSDVPFDKVPVLYLGSESFRHDLTLSEWTATNPAPLPQVEISSNKSFSSAELLDFVSNSNYADALKKIVSIIDNKECTQSIFINDKLENARLWMSVITLLVSPETAHNLSFNTYEYDDANMKIGVPLESKYRIQFITGSSSRMKLQQKILSEAVFDFVNNQFTVDLPIDELVELEFELFKKDIFSASTFAKTIKSYQEKFEVDAPTASKLYRLDLEGCGTYSPNELLSLLKIYSNKESIIKFIEPILQKILSKNYGNGSDVIALGNYLYPNLAPTSQVEYVRFCFDPYFINSSSDISAYINDAKSKYSLLYKEFAHTYNISEKNNIVITNKNNIALIFLFLDSLLSDISYNSNTDLVILENSIHSIANELFANGDNNKALALINKAAPVLPKLKQKFYIGLCDNTPLTSYRSLFEFLKEVDDLNYVANKLYNFVMSYSNKRDAINAYNQFINANSNLKSIDVAIKEKPEIIAILEQIEKEDFVNNINPNNSDIFNYYQKYYLTNKDKDGLFVKAFNKYFSSFRVTSNDACFWVNVFQNNQLPEPDRSLYMVLLNKLSEGNSKDLFKYRKEIDILKNLGVVKSEIEIEIFINDVNEYDDNQFKQALSKNGVFYYKLFNGLDDENRKKLIYNKYFTYLVGKLVRGKTLSYFEDGVALTNLCSPFTSYQDFENTLKSVFQKEKIEDEKFMVILFSACKTQNPASTSYLNVFNSSFAILNDHEKKKFAIYVMKNVNSNRDGAIYNEIVSIAKKYDPKTIKMEEKQKAAQEKQANANAANSVEKQTNEKSNGFFHNLFHKK